MSNDTAQLGFFFCDGIAQGLFMGDDKPFPFYPFDLFPLHEMRNWKCEVDDEFWEKETKTASKLNLDKVS